MIALSIIIVNYKTSEFLRNCLTAIYQSNTPFTYEIIVVDNSSAEEELESIVEQFPKLTLIENSQNVGFVRANNQGIEIAKGEFVLFLNPDTEVRHDAISFMANY
ncbi:MAG: glycosyltransferase, partial [Bacteroidetes bacterium]